MSEGVTAGLPDELGAVDQLLHRGEANPRTRSGIMVVEIFDRAPDWQRYRATYESASRRITRLRQKVVMPTLPTTAPRWVIDPDFNLDFHVRRLRAPEPGTLREVLDIAEVALQSPLDISRPLWSATLVEGLAGGRAAHIVHLSHAIVDGVGGVEMFASIYDIEPEPGPKPVLPLPIPQDLSSIELMREGLWRLPASVAGGVASLLGETAGVVRGALGNPVRTVTGAVGYLASGARVMRPAAPHSALLARRSLSSRTEAIDIRLADLHRAAGAAGGSINDAYLAGLCGALRRYHEAMGMPVGTLPLAVPVNLRSEDDPAGGNRFVGLNLAAPIGTADPARRIGRIRNQMIKRREEVALDITGAVAPVVSLLPDVLLESMAGSVVVSDVQASNVPVYPGDTYIAGVKVLRQYGVGPLPGVAMMAVLVSRGGYCTITTRYDRASITDPELFADCLRAGFDEVLELAGDPIPRCRPASFDPEPDVTADPSGDASIPSRPEPSAEVRS